MNKVQIAIISFSIIIAIAGVIAFSLTGDKEPPIQVEGGQLTVWGTEPAGVFDGVFRAYQGISSVKVVYIEKDPRTFDRELLEALASQKPPDVIITAEDWIRDNRNKIAPPRPEIVNADLEKRNMVELASSLFVEEKTVDGKLQKTVWALPLWLDPLVLFWNKDLFDQAAPDPIARPAEDWDKFLEDSKKMTKLGDSKQVLRAGAALGRAKNIPLYREILSLLLLQLNSDIEAGIYGSAARREIDGAVSAIRFYTGFGNPNTAPGGAYTWNTRLPEPRALFAEGKLGMMLDLYSFARELRVKNPHLAFDIAPVPQVKGGRRVNYAQVRAITVPKATKNQNAAWVLAWWLTRSEQISKVLQIQSAAPAVRDLLESAGMSGLLKTASLTARRPRETYPDTNSRILKDLIESVADGETITKAMSEARDAYNLFLKSQEQ